MLIQAAPVEDASPERLLAARIGNFLQPLLVRESREAAEFPAPALPDQGGQIIAEVAEIEKRLAAAPFLAHEQQGRLG